MDVGSLSRVDLYILAIGYLFLLGTSGLLVNLVLTKVALKKRVEVEPDVKARFTGMIVGKCENVLILTFVILGAYTALGLVVAAKAVIRIEQTKKNPLFYLAGTMLNPTYSVVVAAAIKFLVNVLP
jgi:hypothetical protein